MERRRRQRSEQYFTSFQQSSHFLRQVKARWHTGQIFVGKSDLDRVRTMFSCRVIIHLILRNPLYGLYLGTGIG